MAKAPVVLVHGLWLHTSSWQPWIDLFSERGYDARAVAWPGDGATVADSRADPGPMAGVGIQQVVDHVAGVIATLPEKPIVIGHSFGGLIAQKLLAADLAAAAVAFDPAQIRGVLALPPVQLRNVLPVLSNPLNLGRAVMLTKKRFHRGFASAVSREESDALHDRYVVPSPAKPLFQAAVANYVPGSVAKIDVTAKRGPLLITSGGQDGMVPEVISRSVHKRYAHASTVNDHVVFPDRGHTLCVDAGWREIADTTLDWLTSNGF